MRQLQWVLAILVVSAFLAPLPCGAQALATAPETAVTAQESSADSADALGYAQREAGSGDLEEFTGGSHGVVLVVVLVVAVLVLVALILPW